MLGTTSVLGMEQDEWRQQEAAFWRGKEGRGNGTLRPRPSFIVSLLAQNPSARSLSA